LITAGPTYEKIDPVRFIGNHSSGKMGFEIAKVFLNQGAEVTLVSGPTKEKLTHKLLTLHSIQTAEEMLVQVKSCWESMNLGVFAAAVADYRPESPKDQKIKKNENTMTIDLIKNPDILAWAGANKAENQKLVGFALETNDAEKHGFDKLKRKNLDFIVVNTLEDKGAGFAVDTNRIKIIDKSNKLISFELKPKHQVALDIVNYLNENLKS
jgi:phosphopantothenoylcysteine decarboxylase/phosphopantothenate--cysteine ligase